MPLILCNEMVGYAVGGKTEIKKALHKIKYLRKKRSYGKGGVISLKIEEIENDFSIEKDGMYMRYMPIKNGARYGRIRPPYWNSNKRINTNFIGDAV